MPGKRYAPGGTDFVNLIAVPAFVGVLLVELHYILKALKWILQ